METDGDQGQQGASANGSAVSGTSARPSQMNSMSLYERQAVQALQALQRQPNAAQYFQHLMLQQQINHSLAAVQQASLAVGRQSSTSSNSSLTTTAQVSVTASGGGAITNARPIGPGATATSTISQSVLLSGTGGRQGQMYLRVNRSLRAPISSQLIFMPGSTATTAVATVAQQQPQPQQQKHQEATATSSSSSQSDNDQVRNLALRGVSDAKAAAVKTEAAEKMDSASHLQNQPAPPSSSKPLLPQVPHIKIPTYPQPSTLKSHPTPPSPSPSSSSSSSSSSSIPLSQLLLHGPRALATVTAAAATATHILVPTSNGAPPQQQQHHSYAVGPAVVGAQTLVVQPLQKASLGPGAEKQPVPIQPKSLQGSLRLPLQLPSRTPPPIRPAPPPPPAAPHIPVQIVGARQSALAVAQARSAANAHNGAPPPLGSSSSLLSMVAAIASREGGAAAARGAGLKTLHAAPQEAPPPPPSARVSHVHPQANQSPAAARGGPNGTPAAAPGSSASSSSPPAAVATSSAPLSSSSPSRPSAALPPTPDPRGASPGAAVNGESAGGRSAQGKQATSALKRKSESNVANGEDGPTPLRLQPISGAPAPALASDAVKAGPGSSPSRSPAPPLSVSSRGGRERTPPPQAVIKPQILTHLIEGFVIQEGAEPFPVCGPGKEPADEDVTNDSPDTNRSEAKVLKCEYCGCLAPAAQFRGTKRFCSMTCAKRYNVSFRLRQSQGRHHAQGQDRSHLSHSDLEGRVVRRQVPRRTSSEIASAKIAGRALPVQCHSESSQSEEVSSDEEEEEDDEDEPMSLSPATSPSCHQAPPPPSPVPLAGSTPICEPASPAHWSVEEVSQFISSLQGCEELAPSFLSQEIDGQALMLLREEHLMSTMNIKLGPALKICAHINTLRD